jgi:endonuclease/exonuclease/phosphatase family metal-dependent hydrolase
MNWRHRVLRRGGLLVAVVAASVLLAGCASDPSPPPTATAEPTPTDMQPSSTPPTPSLTVTVMAYNIWFGAGMEPGHAERGSNLNRLEDLISLVKEVDPDILGLEEACGWGSGDPSILSQFADELGMSYYLAPTWRGIDLAILSKFPILETENLSEYVGNNGALRAVVQSPDGGVLNVVVVHLDPADQSLRACQCDKLRRIMEPYAGERSILMGDMNSLPTYREVEYLTQGSWQLAHNESKTLSSS